MAKKKVPQEPKQRKLFMAVSKDEGMDRVFERIEEDVCGVQISEEQAVEDFDEDGCGSYDDEIVIYEITVKAVAHYGFPKRERTQL